ncbi:MAG: hypothetical protein ABFD02_05045, partial [Bacteroidales bacterium]
MKIVKPAGHFIIIFLFFVFGLSCTSATITDDVIKLGGNREIFVDHFLLDKLEGTGILMHHPHDEGIVMHFDKPWEGKFCGYVTIIKDGDLFRAYYRGKHKTSENKELQNTCYAESKDGITWVKPALGLVEVNGSKENNIILAREPETHNFS